MEDPSQPVPLRMCTACGRFHEGQGHFCDKCGAPLTQHAQSDFILGIESRGFALHKATHDPKKLIVVVGTWLWVGPSFALSLVLFASGMSGEGVAGRLLAGLGGLGMLLFGTILFRTTTAWLEGRTGARRTSTNDYNEESEPDDVQACLECGKPFPPSLDQCPSCGWSYRAESSNEEK